MYVHITGLIVYFPVCGVLLHLGWNLDMMRIGGIG